MTNQSQNDPDFYLQVEQFILNTDTLDRQEDRVLNNEIRLFLLNLLCHHKLEEDE